MRRVIFPTRYCEGCNVELIRRSNEKTGDFRPRRFCSIPCARKNGNHATRHSLSPAGKARLSHKTRERMRTRWREDSEYRTERLAFLAQIQAGEKRVRNLRIAWSDPERRKAVSGERSVSWRGGITPVNARIRRSFEYREWRTAVFQRDSYTCVWCRAKRNLHADHIKPFALYPDLRFDVGNGRTLCATCHKTTDTYGAKTTKMRKAA